MAARTTIVSNNTDFSVGSRDKNLAASRISRFRPGVWRYVGSHVFLGTVLSCSCMITSSASAQSLTDFSKTLDQASHAINGLFKPSSAPAGTATPESTPQTGPTANAGSKTINPAISPAYRALFAKGTVTGEDLYGNLKAMRTELQEKHSALAWSKVNLAINQTLNVQALSSGVDVGGILTQVVVSAALETMKSKASAVAMKTLDDYLEYLLDDRRSALAQETVTLPSIEGMTENQARRTITIATLIIAARLSNKVMDKADEDFKSLDTDYKALLDQREKAANLLFATIDLRRAAQKQNNKSQQDSAESDLKQSLSDKDIAFIDSTLNRMPLKDFANDMAAQNLALEYLRAKDPDAFKDYRTKADDVVRRTSAYIRTVSGVAAFGGLAAAFGHSIADMSTDSNLKNVLATMPLGIDFLSSAAPLIKKSVEVSISGVGINASDGIFGRLTRKSFTVITSSKNENVRSASNVFQIIHDSGVSEQFISALFYGDVAGWLNRIRFCDPLESGRMIDSVVAQDERSKFATDYFGWSEPERSKDFAFVNALSQPGASRRERELGDELLGKDQRKHSDSLPIATVQSSIAQHYSQWTNEQLLRIIFNNRESGAAYATLDIADVSVRPVPSAESVYAYESRVESCRKTADQAVGSGTSEQEPPKKRDTKTPPSKKRTT